MHARMGFHVLDVPFDMSFQRVLAIVMEHLFNEEVTLLKYFKTTHDNFTALTLGNIRSENLTRPILEMLEKLIRNPVALYNQNRTCLNRLRKTGLIWYFLTIWKIMIRMC